MVNTVCQFVLLFFVFAVAGWCMEVFLKFIQYHRFINRGFLIGPYCPIYGWGAVAVTVLVGGMIGREGTVSEIFWAGVVMCGALEYFTSWYMETRFHARWWDYSSKPMNLHGRIWIGNLLLFGLASVMIVLLVDPVFFALADRLSPLCLRLLAAAAAALLLSDHAASSVLMKIVRNEIDAQEGDSTEEISQRIHLLLKDRSLLLRRIEQAYPDLRSRPRWLTLQIQQAQKRHRDARRLAARLLRKSRTNTVPEGELDAALAAEKRTFSELRRLRRKQTH